MHLLSQWFESPDLKELQKLWYDKLKESGFEDIEDTNSKNQYLKCWHSSVFRLRHSEESFRSKQEYYRRAGIFLHAHSFENHFDQETWRLHSEGLSIIKITRVLQTNKIKHPSFKLYPENVRLTIERLKTIMFETPEEEEDLDDFE